MKRRYPARRAVSGFTLLEAIVAMTIFSMCALALFGWQSGSLRAVGRVEARAVRADAVRMGLAVVHSVNPMAEPKGERVLGDRRIRWTATPIVPTRSAVTQVGLPSLFDVGLFQVAVSVQRVSDAGDVDLADFNVRAVGYKQVRSNGFEE